ncbi:hypothetical protein [Arhodomonas sp. AD133]|uniref:hypothetical protein n=1 Tax=Arhodomonas sp. AD133 TaxID=3415009 RepID=UPI003EB9BAFC
MAINKPISFASAWVALAASASLLLLTASATASGPPLTGSGDGMFTGVEVTSERQAGVNSIQTRTLHGVITSGPLDGSFIQHVSGVVNQQTGRVTFDGVLIFTGTVEGCSEEGQVDTVTLGLSGRGQAGTSPVTEASFRVIDRRLDEGANTLPVTGQGTVNQNGNILTYDLQYKCRVGDS